MFDRGQIEAALSSCLPVLLFISHASPSYTPPTRKVAANLSLQPVPPHRCGILRVQGKGNVSLPAPGTLQSVNRACHRQLAGPLWRTISVPSFGTLATTSCNKLGGVGWEWGGWVCVIWEVFYFLQFSVKGKNDKIAWNSACTGWMYLISNVSHSHRDLLGKLHFKLYRNQFIVKKKISNPPSSHKHDDKNKLHGNMTEVLERSVE